MPTTIFRVVQGTTAGEVRSISYNVREGQREQIGFQLLADGKPEVTLSGRLFQVTGNAWPPTVCGYG